MSRMELLISSIVSRMELPKMFQVTILLVVNYQKNFCRSGGGLAPGYPYLLITKIFLILAGVGVVPVYP